MHHGVLHEMIDFSLPGSDGPEILLQPNTEPGRHHALLLHQAGIGLPQQSSP